MTLKARSAPSSVSSASALRGFDEAFGLLGRERRNSPQSEVNYSCGESGIIVRTWNPLETELSARISPALNPGYAPTIP